MDNTPVIVKDDGTVVLSPSLNDCSRRERASLIIEGLATSANEFNPASLREHIGLLGLMDLVITSILSRLPHPKRKGH